MRMDYVIHSKAEIVRVGFSFFKMQLYAVYTFDSKIKIV